VRATPGAEPRNPHVERFIEGPRNTSTLQVTLFGDTVIRALEEILLGFGGDAGAPFEEGVLIWDLSNPVDPRKLGHLRTGGTGTHRNLYAGGRYAHLAANMAGFKGNIYGDSGHSTDAGIGRATAVSFAEEGAYVAVSGRHPDKGEVLVAELKEKGAADAAFTRADVRNESEISAMVDQVADR
jgi:hypothetical protein